MNVAQRVLAVLAAVGVLLFAIRLMVRVTTRRIGQILLVLLVLAGLALYLLWKFGLLRLETAGG
jgi:hypothetical protein